MDNKLKHRTKFNKKNTSTKLMSKEFCIIENGEVKATNDYTTALKSAEKGLQVFEIRTYQIQVKQQLKTKQK